MRNARPAGTAWDIGAARIVAQSTPRLLLPANGQQNVTTTPPPSGTNGSWIRMVCRRRGAAVRRVPRHLAHTAEGSDACTRTGPAVAPWPCTSVTYTGTLYFAGQHTPNTTFYWRIVVVTPTATIIGPVWSFRRRLGRRGAQAQRRGAHRRRGGGA
jgi:hypothetical protein